MKKIQWARHQKRWFGKWHTYLGILAGAIIAVIGATGSILVFRTEIVEMMSPSENVLTVPVQEKEPLTFAAVLDSLTKKIRIWKSSLYPSPTELICGRTWPIQYTGI